MIRNTLPLGLVENPNLDQWIGFEEPGIVRVSTGKVELGQGILTALAQIAADELDVAPSRIKLVSGDTDASPAEGYTAGSMSVENSGGSIRLVAAEVRAMLLATAATQIGCDTQHLAVVDGQIERDGVATNLDYWQLALSLDLTKAAAGSAPIKKADSRALIGASLPRLDLPAKVFGGSQCFIHDLSPPDLCSYVYLHEYHRRVTVPSLEIFRNVAEVRLPLVQATTQVHQRLDHVLRKAGLL